MPVPLKDTKHTAEVKALGAVEIKDAAKGEVEACIATLGVVDNDGDFMRPGCIADGSKVMMSDYGHSTITDGRRPVGKGVISVDGNKAIFKGRIFMDTQAGQETFKTLKAMGPDQEWSFGFQVVTASMPSEDEKKQGAYRSLDVLKSFEVSPVCMGAGIGTQTLAVKQADGDVGEPAPVVEVVAEPIVVTETVDTTAAEDAARLAAELAAQQATEAQRVRDAEIKATQETARVAAAMAEEFARFQRNIRKFG